MPTALPTKHVARWGRVMRARKLKPILRVLASEPPGPGLVQALWRANANCALVAFVRAVTPRVSIGTLIAHRRVMRTEEFMGLSSDDCYQWDEVAVISLLRQGRALDAYAYFTAALDTWTVHRRVTNGLASALVEAPFDGRPLVMAMFDNMRRTGDRYGIAQAAIASGSLPLVRAVWPELRGALMCARCAYVDQCDSIEVLEYLWRENSSDPDHGCEYGIPTNPDAVMWLIERRRMGMVDAIVRAVYRSDWPLLVRLATRLDTLTGGGIPILLSGPSHNLISYAACSSDVRIAAWAAAEVARPRPDLDAPHHQIVDILGCNLASVRLIGRRIPNIFPARHTTGHQFDPGYRSAYFDRHEDSATSNVQRWWHLAHEIERSPISSMHQCGAD